AGVRVAGARRRLSVRGPDGRGHLPPDALRVAAGDDRSAHAMRRLEPGDACMTLSRAADHFQESAIRRIGALSASVPGLISFAAGYPAPDVFPWDDLQSITAQILARHDGNTLQYGATRGYRPLLEHLLAHTLSGRGITARFEDVIITSGSQQGLDLVGRVLIDPGDP